MDASGVALIYISLWAGLPCVPIVSVVLCGGHLTTRDWAEIHQLNSERILEVLEQKTPLALDWIWHKKILQPETNFKMTEN